MSAEKIEFVIKCSAFDSLFFPPYLCARPYVNLFVFLCFYVTVFSSVNRLVPHCWDRICRYEVSNLLLPYRRIVSLSLLATTALVIASSSSTFPLSAFCHFHSHQCPLTLVTVCHLPSQRKFNAISRASPTFMPPPWQRSILCLSNLDTTPIASASLLPRLISLVSPT